MGQTPGGGISLSPERPTSELGAESSYFTWSTAPGSRLANGVVVTNGESRDATYAVSAVDAVTADASGASYRDAGAPSSDAADWIRLGSSRVTVPSGGRVVVPFTVQVPAGATPGDHLAGLAFQDVQGSAGSAGPLQVTTVGRSVIGALVRVAGPAPTALAVRGAALEPLAGTGSPVVVVGLDNTGRRLARPQMTVRVQRAGYDRTERRALDTLLPGDPLHYPVRWPEALVPGSYRITVGLTAAGLTPVSFSGEATLAPPGQGQAGAAGQGVQADGVRSGSSGVSKTFVLVVAAASVAVVLLVAGLVLVVLRRRPAPS